MASTATRSSDPSTHAADIERLKAARDAVKIGVPIPTSLSPHMYALKLIGRIIGVGDARGYMDAIISDMETNGVSEKEAMERENLFSHAVDRY